MKKELNWAVLGCGVIANEMAQALEHMGKHLYAVGNRTYEKAVAFAEKYGVQKVYDDFHEKKAHRCVRRCTFASLLFHTCNLLFD